MDVVCHIPPAEGANMVDEKILHQIKQAESRVAEGLERARIKKEEIILSARSEAEKRYKAGEQKIDAQMAQRLAEAKEEMEKEKKEVSKKGDKEISELSEASSKNKERAIPLILDIFKETFNA